MSGGAIIDAGLGQLAGQFFNLYQGNQRSTGRFDPMSGKMHTDSFGPTVEDWLHHLRGTRGIGLVPIRDDGTCIWGAIDIDNHGSDEDTPIVPIDEAIAANHLPMIACRSKSGGVHCYAFFDKPMPAGRVRGLLTSWATKIGYPGAEVFPKQNRLATSSNGKQQLGNWINLPYLGGDKTIRYGFKGAKKLTAAEFIALAEKTRATATDIRALTIADHAEAPPCVQKMIAEGVGAGQRNEALYNITVYLRKAHPAEFLTRATDLNALAFDKPLPKAEATRTINSAGRPDYSYRCGEEPCRGLCEREKCITRRFGISPQEFETLAATADLPPFSELVKYISEPVRWELKVDNKVITNVSTEQLLEWRFMRLVIAEKLTRVVPMIKNNEWERLLQPLMQHARIIETPDDASIAGVIRERLKEFASKTDLTNRGEDTGDRKAMLRGLPCVQVYDGERVVMFRQMDLVNYLKRTKSEELKGVSLWFAVRDLGVMHAKLRAGKSNINIWYMPVSVVLDDRPIVEATEFVSEI